MSSRRIHEEGMISGLQITVVGLAVLVLGLGSFAIWAFVGKQDAEQNLQSKIDVAVAEGQKKQADEDEEKFAKREAEPMKTFHGPDDYCSLTFKYPKTWSAYESTDIKDGGTYYAYLNADKVKPIKEDQQFSLRVTIEQKDFDTVLAQYKGLIDKGTLKPSTISSQGNPGTRLEGNFTKNIRGAAVFYDCRNYTIMLRTDIATPSALKDFDSIVQTIDFK